MDRVEDLIYEFGAFQLDPQTRRLLEAGEPVAIWPKALEMLCVLVENGGRVVSKDVLMQRVWPDTVVDENNLTVNISLIRKALRQGRQDNRYIVTVPGQGYKFVASVRALSRPPAASNQLPAVSGSRQMSAPPVAIEGKRVTGDEGALSPVSPSGQTASALPDEQTSQTSASYPVGQIESRWRQTSASRKTAVAVALLAVVAVVVIALSLGRKPAPVASVAAVRSLAVLPLQSLRPQATDAEAAAEAANDYLCIGLTDALITKLSNLRQMNVRPTSAILKYARGEQPSLAVGRELGVEALLEGSMQRDGDRLRITVQLVRVSDGVPLWAGTFDENFTDIFSVQDSISEQVARSLALEVSGSERALMTKSYTRNVEAYRLYLNGRYYWSRRTPADIRQAIELFKQSIVVDKQYALAYAGLADAYNMLGIQEMLLGGEALKEVFPQAKAAATEALRLDESLAEAHTAMAIVYSAERDWAACEREFRRAIELNPNSETARGTYSVYLMSLGRFDEAFVEASRAAELDPLSPLFQANIGAIYFRSRRYDQAAAQLEKVVQMAPGLARSYWLLGQVYDQQGRHQEAIAALAQANRLSGGAPLAVAMLGRAYARAGKAEEARRLLRQLDEMATQRHVSPYYVAALHVALGDAEEAFASLEKELRAPSFSLSLLKVDANFDALRADARFATLLRRAGLSP